MAHVTSSTALLVLTYLYNGTCYKQLDSVSVNLYNDTCYKQHGIVSADLLV